MASQGPAYGLSKELAAKSSAKFSPEKAQECLQWVQQVTGGALDLQATSQDGFGGQLKDGKALCNLINKLAPGSVKKVNTMNAPFKQRENIEMYLNACSNYGMTEGDLFQVNDLYEQKNIYMVVDNLRSLGGLAQKKGWGGPSLGVKVATENKREFSQDTINAGKSVVSLQMGTNKGASQAGMTMGATRPINASEFVLDGDNVLKADQTVLGLQYGTNKGASQAGMSMGSLRPINAAEFVKDGDKVLKADQSFSGLQMGSNKGASQKGMTFGAARPINAAEFVQGSEGLGGDQSVLGLQAGTNKGASQAGMRAYGASRPVNPKEM